MPRQAVWVDDSCGAKLPKWLLQTSHQGGDYVIESCEDESPEARFFPNKFTINRFTQNSLHNDWFSIWVGVLNLPPILLQTAEIESAND